MTNESDLIVCSECGAVAHGNLFCNTCRQVMNKVIGCNLPALDHKPEKPCGIEEIQKLINKLG